MEVALPDKCHIAAIPFPTCRRRVFRVYEELHIFGTQLTQTGPVSSARKPAGPFNTTTSAADWRRRYLHLAMRRHRSIAKVAMDRRLGVRLYWMWRNGREYSPSMEFGSYVGQLGTGHGAK
jgi:hypothetical protein